jgi:hypothetical protein
MTKKSLSSDGLIGLAVMVCVLLFPWSLLSVRVVRMWRYNVSWQNVHIDKTPRDCDWMYAPLGEKACHYEPEDHSVPDFNNRITEVYVSWRKVQD